MNKHVPAESDAITHALAFITQPESFANAAKQNVKAIEELVRGSQAIGEKLVANSAKNMSAALEAAQGLASAKTVPDLLRLQAEFVQKQFATVFGQSQEIVSLSTKTAQDAFQSMTA